MARRVRVRWQTEEVLEFEQDFQVPDEVADDQVEDYFTDGNNELLVAVNADEGALLSFQRETESVVWLEGEPERSPRGEYRVDLRWVIEAESPEDAVNQFREQLTNPRLTLAVTAPDGTVVEV